MYSFTIYLVHSTKDERGHMLVQSSPLHPYLLLTFPQEDFSAIQKLSVDFERFGLHMLFNDLKIYVTHVPSCYLAREVNEVGDFKIIERFVAIYNTVYSWKY